MKKAFSVSTAIILGSLIWTFFPTKVEAGLKPVFGGEYTNLFGSGLSSDSHNDATGKCNAGTGICSGKFVIRTVCEGITTNCDDGTSHTSPIQVEDGNASRSVNNPFPGFNRTVQIDVFDKSCRKTDGSWNCADNEVPADYLVWYSGNSAPTATPTQAPAPTTTPTWAPVPTTTPTPRVPTVPPVPTVPVIDAEVRCPDGFVRTISGSNIICLQQIQNQNQSSVSSANASTGPITVSLASNFPQGVPLQVVPVETKQPVVFTQELPKTGLPLVVWAFSGLAPLGLKLKRFGSTSPKGNSILALWQEREFLRS